MNIEELTKEQLIEYIENMNEENNGRYGLIWDKEKEPEKIVEECNKFIPILKEVKEKNIENNGENNILIEGDNFHALSVLNYTHKELVDVIYIDPPYNTGNEDFVYNDKFIDEEDGYRHSKWLNFMQKRLKIARELLKPDGMIMISIDDNEFAQLKLLCDRIFKRNNLLSIQHIQVRYDNKTLNEKNDWQPVMEYVLIYAKDAGEFKANKPQEDYSIDKFVYEFEELTEGLEYEVKGRKVKVFKKGEWHLKKHAKPAKNLLKDTWVSGSIYSGTGNGPMVQSVIEPRIQLDGYGSLYKIYGLGEDGLGYRYFTGPQKAGATRCKMYSGIPLAKSEDIDNGVAVKYKSIPNYHDFSADFGNIRHEGGVPFNSGKKPTRMLKQFINYHPAKDAVVLDFFAGSGSTGHAVLELNKEDGGNRKFILCTNNEVSKKLQHDYMQSNNLTEKELLKIKENPDEKWLEYVEKNGICSTATHVRIKNVINSDIELEGSLKYFKTQFVENNSTTDQIYYDLTEKCIPMLCVKEDTFVECEKNDEYVIYSNKNKTKYTCVYFDIYGSNYDIFKEKMKNMKESKSLYIFTLGNNIPEEELEEISNYKIEPIPQKIYDLYKKLVRLAKED